MTLSKSIFFTFLVLLLLSSCQKNELVKELDNAETNPFIKNVITLINQSNDSKKIVEDSKKAGKIIWESFRIVRSSAANNNIYVLVPIIDSKSTLNSYLKIEILNGQIESIPILIEYQADYLENRNLASRRDIEQNFFLFNNSTFKLPKKLDSLHVSHRRFKNKKQVNSSKGIALNSISDVCEIQPELRWTYSVVSNNTEDEWNEFLIYVANEITIAGTAHNVQLNVRPNGNTIIIQAPTWFIGVLANREFYNNIGERFPSPKRSMLNIRFEDLVNVSSNCIDNGGGDGGDGGGSSGGGVGVPPNNKDIHNQVKDECLSKAVDETLKVKDIVGTMSGIIANFDRFKTVNLTIADRVMKDDHGNEKPGETNKMRFDNGVFFANIDLNPNYFAGTSKESVSTTLIHEMVHAFLGYTSNNFLNEQTHEVIAEKYITPMALFLLNEFDMSLQDAYALAWSGMADSSAFSNATNESEFIMANGEVITKIEIIVKSAPYKDSGEYAKGIPICQ